MNFEDGCKLTFLIRSECSSATDEGLSLTLSPRRGFDPNLNADIGVKGHARAISAQSEAVRIEPHKVMTNNKEKNNTEK